MNNRVKYAEIEYRHRLFNACKGILRVKQGEASGMIKTALDLIPSDYEMIAKAVENAQMMQAYGIPLSRAERKALAMFDRMPDMDKLKVMQAGGVNISSYHNSSVNVSGDHNILTGVATGDGARAAGGAQNNVENNGFMVGSGNQQNYVGGAPGGGGGYGYTPGYGAPAAGPSGGGWGFVPGYGWVYYGPDGKPTTPSTEGKSEAKTEAAKPGAGVHFVMGADGKTVSVTYDNGTTEQLPIEEFKAKFNIGGPEKPKLLTDETGAEAGAKPEAGKPGDGGIGDRPIKTINNGDGTWTLIYADGRKIVRDAAGKVISKTDADGTTTASDTSTGETKVTEPGGTETTIAGTSTGDPEKDITTTGGPTDADYADMRRSDHRNKFINDFVDRKNNEFNKRWNGAGIASGIAGAATMGTGGYHAGNALAKHLGWVDDKGNDKGWGAKALRWGGALLGAGLGGTTGYYSAKGIDRARRQSGYREIGGRAYDRVVKPVVKDMDPSKIVTASYSADLVKKLRKQCYRYTR